MPDSKEFSQAAGSGTFEMDLRSYERDYARLLMLRSVPPVAYWLNKPITAESIGECLSSYYESAPIAILLYFYDEGALKIWLIDRNGIQFDGKSNIGEQELNRLEKALKAGLNTGKYDRLRKPRLRGFDLEEAGGEGSGDIQTTIAGISKILLPAGLGQKLLDLKTEHLIIVPSLNIQQIPLALLKPLEDESTFMDHWSYSFAPSIYGIADLILRKHHESSQEAGYNQGALSEEALFVGNPDFAEHKKWILPSLPGAEAEVLAVSKKLRIPDTQVLTGKAATKEMVLEKTAGASILFLATHGVADPEDPLHGSGLFFAPSKRYPEGFWSAKEIQHSKLKALLVVLSACQTGLGSAQDAGVIGLSRAFHLAGAENVVMSLWSVGDDATREFMEIFMEKIQAPHRFFPGGPLRQTMLEYRAKNPDPLAWAAFSVFGLPV